MLLVLSKKLRTRHICSNIMSTGQASQGPSWDTLPGLRLCGLCRRLACDLHVVVLRRLGNTYSRRRASTTGWSRCIVSSGCRLRPCLSCYSWVNWRSFSSLWLGFSGDTGVWKAERTNPRRQVLTDFIELCVFLGKTGMENLHAINQEAIMKLGS